jgi:hypothetical protein
MSFEPDLLLILFASINAVALLVLGVSRVGRPPAATIKESRRARKQKRQSGESTDYQDELIKAAERSNNSDSFRLRGERRLAEDLARWREKKSSGEILPQAAGKRRGEAGVLA